MNQPITHVSGKSLCVGGPLHGRLVDPFAMCVYAGGAFSVYHGESSRVSGPTDITGDGGWTYRPINFLLGGHVHTVYVTGFPTGAEVAEALDAAQLTGEAQHG